MWESFWVHKKVIRGRNNSSHFLAPLLPSILSCLILSCLICLILTIYLPHGVGRREKGSIRAHWWRPSVPTERVSRVQAGILLPCNTSRVQLLKTCNIFRWSRVTSPSSASPYFSSPLSSPLIFLQRLSSFSYPILSYPSCSFCWWPSLNCAPEVKRMYVFHEFWN